MHIQKKFWRHVEERLTALEGPMYYAGGTLCVDFKESGVALNLDGKGFVYGKLKGKCDHIYQPKHILDLVIGIYLKEKGETEHFQNEIAA